MVKVQKILSDRDFLKYRNKTRLYEADEFDTLTEDNTGTENTEGDKALTDEELKIESLKLYSRSKERKKAVQPNGCTALIHQLFSSEWQ